MSSQRPAQPEYHDEALPDTAPKKPIWKRTWAVASTIGLVALFVGVGIGTSSASVEDNPDYVAAQDALKSAHADSDAAESHAEDLQDQLDDAAAKSERLDARATALREQAAKLDKRSSRLDARAAKLKKRAGKLDTREAKVAAAEDAVEADQAAKANTDDSDSSGTGGGGGTDQRFNYCYEANDAGYGPYYQGEDPEYDWYRDADSDGTVCES